MEKNNWIQRSPKTSTDNYTLIPNSILRSNTLTMLERSLLCYLLSLPPNWRVRKTEIQQHMIDVSRRSYDKAFKGLVEKGHIIPLQLYKNNLKNGVVYFVFETPETGATNIGTTENGVTDTGGPERGTLQITKEQTKDKQTKDDKVITNNSNISSNRTSTDFDFTDTPPIEVQQEMDRFLREKGLL